MESDWILLTPVESDNEEIEKTQKWQHITSHYRPTALRLVLINIFILCISVQQDNINMIQHTNLAQVSIM